MADMDPFQMQIQMIRSQAEAQKNMYRQMYASDPAVVEQFCAQLDQSLQMQIQMITQMSGIADSSGYVDPDAQARAVLEQLGYSDEEVERAMGCDDGDSLTEKTMGSIEPDQFGYGDRAPARPGGRCGHETLRDTPDGDHIDPERPSNRRSRRGA